MARFKFAKVISSVLIANAFIGFVLPKINQAITRSYHKNKPETSAVPVEQNNSQAVNPFVARPMMDSFAPNKRKRR